MSRESEITDDDLDFSKMIQSTDWNAIKNQQDDSTEPPSTLFGMDAG